MRQICQRLTRSCPVQQGMNQNRGPGVGRHLGDPRAAPPSQPRRWLCACHPPPQDTCPPAGLLHETFYSHLSMLVKEVFARPTRNEKRERWDVFPRPLRALAVNQDRQRWFKEARAGTSEPREWTRCSRCMLPFMPFSTCAVCSTQTFHQNKKFDKRKVLS